jgi:hypothetical protein
MRKLILFFGAILFLHNVTKAQAQAYTGQSDFNKSMQSAAIIEYPFADETTSDAINAKFKDLGFGGKNEGDYRMFKEVKLKGFGDSTYDLYFKVERKSKKEKDKSVVYLIISRGYEKFYAEASSPNLFNDAKNFLTGLLNDVAARDLENQIAAQEDVVKKANKKFNNLTDDGKELTKKKNKLEQEIEDNKSKAADQQKELDAQKQILDMLKGKRK